MASRRSDNVTPDPFSALLPQKEQKSYPPNAPAKPIAKPVSQFIGKFCVKTSTGEYIPLVPSVAVPPVLGLPQRLTIGQVQAQDWNVVEGEYDPGTPSGYTLEPVPSYHSTNETSPKSDLPSPPTTPPQSEKGTHGTGAANDVQDKAREKAHSRKVNDFLQLVKESSDQKIEPSPGPAPLPRPEPREVIKPPRPHTPCALDGTKLGWWRMYEGLVGIPPWDRPHEYEPRHASKQYCTYWLRKGECDYAQRTCKYSHFFPPRWDWMDQVGFRDLPRWFTEAYPKATTAMLHILGPQPWEQEAKKQIAELPRKQFNTLVRLNGGPQRAFPSYAAPRQLQQHFQHLRGPAMPLRNAHPGHKKALVKVLQYESRNESTDRDSDISLMSSKYAPGMLSPHKGPKRGHKARGDGSVDIHMMQAGQNRLERPKHSRSDKDVFVGVCAAELDPEDSRSEVSSLMKFSNTGPSHGRKGSRNTASVASSRPPYMPEPLQPMQAHKLRRHSIPAAVPTYTPARMPTPIHPDMFTDRDALRNASSVAEVEAKNEAMARALYNRAQKGKPALTGPQRLHRQVQSNMAMNQRLAALADTDRDLQLSSSSASSKSSNIPVQVKPRNGTACGRKRGKKPGQKKSGNGQGHRGKSPETPSPAGDQAAGPGKESSSNGSAALDGHSITGASEQKMKPIGAERLGA